MSLDTGTISFRAFYLRDDIAFCPADVVTFLAAWFGLYQGFVKVRSDAKAWGLITADVREWVSARNGGRSV